MVWNAAVLCGPLPDPQASCAWSCRLILKPIAGGTLGRVETSKVQADVDAKKTDTLFPSVDASVVHEGDVTSDWTEEVEEDMTLLLQIVITVGTSDN